MSADYEILERIPMNPRYQLPAILILTSLILLMFLGAGCMHALPSRDIYLLKVDTSGAGEWSRIIDTGGDDAGMVMIQSPDGGYAIAGEYTPRERYQDTLRVIKTDNLGRIEWEKNWDDDEKIADSPFLIQSPLGIEFIRPDSYVILLEHGVLLKITSTGQYLSHNNLFTSGNYVHSVIWLPKGNIAVIGELFNYTSYRYDPILATFDNNGNILWQYLNPNRTTFTSFTNVADGGFVIGADQGVVRVDAEGREVWYTSLDGEVSRIREVSGERFDAILSDGSTEVFLDSEGNVTARKSLQAPCLVFWTSDGGYACIHPFQEPRTRAPHIVKLDSNGTTVWDREYPDAGPGIVQDFIETNDGGFAVLMNYGTP